MPHDRASSSHALRTQLILAAVGLVIGFVVLPALVYHVGLAVIGTYAGGAHRLGSFYGALFADLTRGSSTAWILVGAPYVLLLLLRLILWRRVSEDGDSAEPVRETVRKEPRVT